MRCARLPAATLAALLVLAGCASPPEPRLAMPESTLIDAQPGGDAAGRMADLARRGAQPAREPGRDLGPLRMRETPARASHVAASRQMVQPDNATRHTGERVELNFVDAELGAVVRALARFTGRNFVVDPRVKGQLTLVSEAPVSPPVAYGMLAGALRMQGFAVVDASGISRVVPEPDAKLQGVPVTTGRDTPQAGGLATRVFTLQYENAANLVPVLRPMISPNNPINAYSNNNTLVVTDYAENLERIAEVIAGIDTPASISADVIPIRHGVASDVAALVGELLDTQGADPTQRITVVADPRSNVVLVRASSPARAQLARDLVRRIDSPESRPGNMHVVYLRNAQATQLADVLRGALTGQSGGSSGAGSGSGSSSGLGGGLSGETNVGLNNARGSNSRNDTGSSGMGMSGLNNNQRGMAGAGALGGSGGQGRSSDTQPTAFSAGGATVQADPSTNTLIITAPEPLYRSLREVIDQLDQRRAQVLVETLIVEVTASQEAQFGIQWMAGGSGLGRSGTSVIGGANYTGTGINAASAVSTIDALPQGLNLGVLGGTVNVASREILNLGVLARAMASDANNNILSTPNLLTLDNEEASIVVGRTVPFQTGAYSSHASGGGNAVNPFQTFNREDVGLTLRVRPQISEGGTVKLAVYQEVSSIEGSPELARAGNITTRKRALNTHVLVDDGQIIVLGGLLEDSGEDSSNGVPFLKDIPGIGALFRFDTRKREKTNLMVFLRPHIVRNAQDTRRVSLDRYDYMRRAQDNSRPQSRWTMPDMPTPTLPALPGLPVRPGDPLTPHNGAIGNRLDEAGPARAPDAGVPAIDLRTGRQDQTLRQAPPPTQITERTYAAPPVPVVPEYQPQPPSFASTAATQGEADPRAVLIQITEAASANDAQNIVRRLRNNGLTAFTQTAPGGTGALVRARIGADAESMESVMTLLRELGYQPSVL